MSTTRVIAALRNHKHFLITTHVNMEGDALGALLSMGRLVRRLGKKVTLMVDDALPYEYRFMPGLAQIKRYTPAARAPFDCAILVDCSDLGRCGNVAALARGAGTLVNIDHHITNDRFGTVNWVDPDASSASEMVYGLYRAMKIPLDRQAALQVYTGIFTDTGSFRYANTTPRVHRIAADLMRFGFDVAQLYRYVYEEVPYADMRLLSALTATMRRDPSGKLVWITVPAQLLRKASDSFDISEHLLQAARSIRGAQVAVLFKENLGGTHDVRVNFRAKGTVDVARVARACGGGGPRDASGCTMRGSLASVVARVLALVRRQLK